MTSPEMRGEECIRYIMVSKDARDSQKIQDLALRIRAIRLRALKTDKEAFSSLYVEELSKPPDFWLKRLSNPKARQLVAIKHCEQSDQGDRDRLQGDWVGILTLLCSVVIDADEENNDRSRELFVDGPGFKEITVPEHRTPVLEYHMAGMWVAPEVRRQGTGRGLIHKALEFIKQDCKQAKASKAIVTIGACDNGIGAQTLYESVGFRRSFEDCYRTSDGRDIRDFVMRLDVEVL